MAGDLFNWEGLNKVQLVIYSIWNAEVRYDWQFNLIKWPKQGEAGTFFHRNGENKYDWGFVLLENLRYFTAEDLFYSEGQNKGRLKVYFTEKPKRR